MDALVSQYSRPAHAQAAAAEQQEDLDFTQDMPALSLKFAVPPVAQVCTTTALRGLMTWKLSSKNYTNLNLSLQHGSAQQPTTTPTQTAQLRSLTEPLHLHSDFREVLSSLPIREQLPETGLLPRPSRRLLRSTTACWARWPVVLLYVISHL